MKAWVFDRHLHLQQMQVDKPVPQQGQSLIKVLASGICGSDMHAWHGHDERRQPPTILGHEVAGIVEEGTLKGKLVTMNPMICCGTCSYCLSGRQNICSNRDMIGMNHPGGFADYLCIADQCLIEVPEKLSPQTAALTEPVAVCVHAINLAKKSCGQTNLKAQKTLVIGGGAIGLITALLLLDSGCGDVTVCDTNPLRVDTVQRALNGTTGTVINNSTEEIPEKNYDLIFDAVGSTGTRALSLRTVLDGGCIIHLGLQQPAGDFDARRLTIGEIQFIGAYTYTQSELSDALQRLNEQRLGDLSWVEIRPFEAAQKSFEDIHNNLTPAAKIILSRQG